MKAAPYGKGAHVLRKPDHAPRKKAAPVAAVDYPTGYFTELMVQHNCPPGFKPAMTVGRNMQVQLQATQAMLDAGRGFAGVSLGLPGAKEHISRWKSQASKVLGGN